MPLRYEDNSSQIVCLGWGSLIWDPRDLALTSVWQEDGPVLPLEFARKSNDGCMTLVVCEQGTLCTTLWATMEPDCIDDARAVLASREGLPSSKNAAYWTPKGSSNHVFAPNVEAWAVERGFAGAVWTGLPPKSPASDRNHDHPSIDEVLAHLRTLDGDSRKKRRSVCAPCAPAD